MANEVRGAPSAEAPCPRQGLAGAKGRFNLTRVEKVALLLAGCSTLLFAFFIDEPARFHDATIGRGEEFASKLPVLTTRLGDFVDGRPPPSRGQEEMIGRLGANMMIRSGFLHSAAVDDNGRDPVVYSFQVNPDVMACVRRSQQRARSRTEEVADAPPGADGPSEGDRREIEAAEPPAAGSSARDRSAEPNPVEPFIRYAIAVVAAEKFNRGYVRRRTELSYARVHSAVTGRVPDLSYGPAQIRVSRLRRLMADQGELASLALRKDDPSDKDILTILQDECSALALTALILFDEAQRIPQIRCEVGSNEQRMCPDIPAAIRAYNGEARNSLSILNYADIVKTAGANTSG
jgi:hypothetical protein